MSKRTTLTLEDDVASALREQAMDKGVSIKELANQALKVGLSTMSNGKGAKPYRLTPQSMGNVVGGVNLIKALALADQLDDEITAKKLDDES